MTAETATEKQNIFSRFTEDGWALSISGIIIIGTLLFAWINPQFTFLKPIFKWESVEQLVQNVLAGKNLILIAGIGAGFTFLFTVVAILSGQSAKRFIKGFLVIYILAILSLVIAGNKSISYYGVEYVIFGLLMGLLLSNIFTIPAWLKLAARSEFYIKTGLVILGSSVLFGEIVKAGLPGLLQALVVVLGVWFFAMWLCRKLKVDDEFAVILASAVSICGVSAAIVASGAINGDKRKLSYVTTLVLLVAIPMMILQPWLVKWLNIPDLVGGAWLGGTLDTTASVTAAAQMLGPSAMKAGVIVKFSQNVLIGVAAVLIAAWWIYKKKGNNESSAQKMGLGIIWDRFPKFVLGFIAVSLLFSFALSSDITVQVSGWLNSMRTICFALAFVAIGMEASFKDLAKMQGGRPAMAFIGAQIFNIILTLIVAYLLFGGYILPVPTIQ